MPAMAVRSPISLLQLILLAGGCSNTSVAERPSTLAQPSTIAQPMSMSPQPVASGQLTTGSVKSYRQKIRTFDRSLTPGEKSAVMSELKQDIARHKAVRQN